MIYRAFLFAAIDFNGYSLNIHLITRTVHPPKYLPLYIYMRRRRKILLQGGISVTELDYTRARRRNRLPLDRQGAQSTKRLPEWQSISSLLNTDQSIP